MTSSKEERVEADIDVEVETVEVPDRVDPDSNDELDIGEEALDPSHIKIEQIKEQLKRVREQTGELRRQTKSVDKKQKRAITQQLEQLEQKEGELRTALDTEIKLIKVNELVHGPSAAELQAQKASLARVKKQAKREAKAHVDAQKFAESRAMAALIPNLGRLERDSFEKILHADELVIHEIEPDGNCLFAALSHQLLVRHSLNFDPQALRAIAAQHIQSHEEKYAAFIDTDEPLTFYCKKLREGELWGGHLELDALQEALHVPIIVYQANGPPLRFGLYNEESVPELSPLRICFQRYAYSLGEHYDSLINRPPPLPPK